MTVIFAIDIMGTLAFSINFGKVNDDVYIAFLEKLRKVVNKDKNQALFYNGYSILKESPIIKTISKYGWIPI